MKFLCKTQDLLQALHIVSRAIGSQQALPILGNVLIRVAGKECIVSATDLELSITTSFAADIETEGVITVPAKAIVNFAQYNSDSEVSLEVQEGTQLLCKSAHAKTMISGESAKEYPTITSVEGETSFTLDPAALLDALHLVTFASAKTSLRPVLSGVYLRREGEFLILVATDSYRLSEYKIAASGASETLSCIIPAKVLEELKSVLSKKPDDKQDGEKPEVKERAPVKVTIGSQQIELSVGSTRLLSRLIEGKFPPYQQIIPSDTKTTVHVSMKELTSVTKRMHYFAKEVNNNLTFSFGSGAVHMVTPATQMGRDEADITIDMEGADNKIALSSSYLLDFLGHADGDTVKMQITDSMRPAVFRIPSRDHFLHLIMPLRIQES